MLEFNIRNLIFIIFFEDFAWRFYKAVADESGNIIFSPYSISTALAMTSRGAAHNTLGEMYRVSESIYCEPSGRFTEHKHVQWHIL